MSNWLMLCRNEMKLSENCIFCRNPCISILQDNVFQGYIFSLSLDIKSTKSLCNFQVYYRRQQLYYFINWKPCFCFWTVNQVTPTIIQASSCINVPQKHEQHEIKDNVPSHALDRASCKQMGFFLMLGSILLYKYQLSCISDGIILLGDIP